MVLFESLLISITASIKITLLICLVPTVDNTRTIAQAAGWKVSSNEWTENKIFESDSYDRKLTPSWKQELRSDQDEIISSDMEDDLTRALTKSWEQELDKVKMSSRTLLTTQELAYPNSATKDTISQYSESQTTSKQCECISNVEKRSVTEFSENKDVTVRKPPLNIALLLPTLTTGFQKYQFAKAYVKPAVVIALKTTPIFQNYEVNIIDIDTRVLASVTVNQMFNAKMKYGNIHLYLGPVSDYCMSPSAKQLRYWNEPMITPGGLASDFSDLRMASFPTLTLIGAQSGTQTLVTATGAIFDQFKFRRTLLVYEDTYEGEEVDNQCFFVIKAYYTMLRRITNVYEFDHWKLDENSKHYINKLLYQEIANKFAGEFYG